MPAVLLEVTVDDWISMAEAAKLAHISVEALRVRWRRYQLPVTKLKYGRERVLIRRSDLQAHLRETC